MLSSCSDFEEINEDPNQVGESKVKPEWFLNASIIGAQMNPEIAERIFIAEWNRASRFNRGSGFTIGTDNNDYITLYLSNSYAVSWLNKATKAIELGEKKWLKVKPNSILIIRMSSRWPVFGVPI